MYVINVAIYLPYSLKYMLHKGRDCLSHTTVVSGFMCSCIISEIKKKIKVLNLKIKGTVGHLGTARFLPSSHPLLQPLSQERQDALGMKATQVSK